MASGSEVLGKRLRGLGFRVGLNMGRAGVARSSLKIGAIYDIDVHGALRWFA